MKLQHQKYVRRSVNVLQMAAVALIYLYFYNVMLCYAFYCFYRVSTQLQLRNISIYLSIVYLTFIFSIAEDGQMVGRKM
jgi:hypothetical protein